MAVGSDQALSARVVLTGASSQIGVFAIPRLVGAGFQVLALSRNGKPGSWPDHPNVNWYKPGELHEHCEDSNFLLSAGPMDVALQILKNHRCIKTAVVFSSSSVHIKTDSNNRAEKDQIRDMLAIQSQLRLLADERNIRLLILKPTLIYGCGLDTNISQLAGWIRRFGFMPVNGNAEGLRQPVHAEDLATVAVAALNSQAELPAELFLAGGETLSYREMVGRIFAALGKPERVVRLPQWLFVLMARLIGILRPRMKINTEMVKRQKLDLVFDDGPAKNLLDYKPRPFAPAESDFSLPGGV